ncbi:response regulator [Leptolyngbya ohadii]|uniref:response regulator n=1 Tax=Leptolyngbya ohadii TaxID=1962290 RepID=UPI000B59F178|nr:response regulator [Leptolyngbya ohadii]
MIPKCILVVDDERPIREAVRLCLEIIGNHRVITAGSGEEGLQIAAIEQPDVILLDRLMPQMDGIATFETLLQDPVIQSIPVILLTAQMEADGTEALLRKGFAGIIHKPFLPNQLAAQIGQILGWSEI